MSVIDRVSLTPCGKHWQTVIEVYLVSTCTIWIQYGLLNTRVNAATGRACAAKARVRFYASTWGICGGQIWQRNCLFSSHFFFNLSAQIYASPWGICGGQMWLRNCLFSIHFVFNLSAQLYASSWRIFGGQMWQRNCLFSSHFFFNLSAQLCSS
jgi:hypothetical protein